MRTVGVLAVVLSFGVAFALVAGSGVGIAIFGEDPSGEPAGETLDELGEDAAIGDEEGEGIGADVGSDSEPTVTGFVLSGGQFVVSLLGSVALLPITLVNLGFPTWFAFPIGSAAQIIAAIGVFQFVTGRELL